MFARVVTWEGADPAVLDATVAGIRDQVEAAGGKPPEGVPATGMLMLTDREQGKTVMIALFASEADRREGDATLNAMSPPIQDGMGRRVSVEMLDVAVQMLP
jgi:hypothetical protein